LENQDIKVWRFNMFVKEISRLSLKRYGLDTKISEVCSRLGRIRIDLDDNYSWSWRGGMS